MRGYGTDRISRIAGLTPISSAPLSREVVLSKTSLAGICLITFACGIVTTVMVDRARSRAVDQVAAREADPGLTRTAGEPAPIAPAPTPAAPAATAPAMPTAPSAAATDPLVVQMPNLDEASRARTIHAVPVAPVRPRLAEAPVAAPKSKPPTAVAPAAAALKAKAAPAAPAAVVGQAKPAPAVVAPAKAKPAVVATAAPLPSRTKAAVAPGPDQARPASSTVVKTKVAVAKPTASAKPPAVAKLPASAKTPAVAKTPASAKTPAVAKPPASAKTKKAKPANEGSDPANGWVDPFTL
jgi:neurofilament heavy polypeptide